MTLIYNEPHKPGLHALIIGVEDALALFSCADSAVSVADWLQTLETGGTKLASIELLIHSTSGREFFYHRGRDSHRLDPPTVPMLQEAVHGWRERLQGEGQNVAFFYFAGPTVDHEGKTCLIAPASIHPRPSSNLVDLDNLWHGMADLALRQLFFIEGCRSDRSDVELRGNLLLPAAAAPASRRSDRARYFGRVPTMVGPALHLPAPVLSGALRDALDRDGLIDTFELGTKLGALFDRRMRDMGAERFEPLETVYEGRFPLPTLFGNWKHVVSADGSPNGTRKADDPAPGEAGDERDPSGGAEEGVEKKTGPVEAQQTELAARRRAARQREQAERLARLTESQRACLRLVYRRMETRDIARTLGISEDGVTRRIKTAMTILGVHRRRDAALILAEVEGPAPFSGANEPLRDPPPADAHLADPAPDVAAGGETPAAAPRAVAPVAALRVPLGTLIGRLTREERDCLRLASEGKTALEIADLLNVSDDAVTSHLLEAAERLGAASIDEAAASWARYDAAREATRVAREATRIARLTERQRQCLALVGQGLSSKEIAARLNLSQETVNRYLSAANRILGVADHQAAARLLAAHDQAAGDATTASPAGPEAALSGARGARPAAPEANTHFVSDDPEVERDELNRGPLAIALGRRLHRIWCRSNGVRMPGDDQLEAGGDERSAFVLHLDAPWGGGKTSFANFLARVLNPFPRGGSEAAKFLVERAGGAVGTIFIDDPPAGGEEGGAAAQWPEDARRPWIVVPFNAWQAEHCSPPWWTFYQAIRKGCFAAVWAEGRSAARPAQASAPPRPLVEERIWSWAALWARELWWRLRNPKVVGRLSTFAVAAAVTAALWQMGLIFRGQTGGLALDSANTLGLALVGATTLSGLWSLGALLTESVAPGTDDLAERRSLGGGDPFERFRRHFCGMIAAVRRPVMVIVDDLDRCRPDFVVDLVRGIQTLLRSPRVVFVILGDRDWIERAFEAHHAAMSKVNVGPEQDFGARFVEKAIQMSFILPEMAEPSQDSYVRRVLIGPGGSAAAADAPAPPEIAQQLRADYREKVAAAPTPEARKQAEGELLEQYRGELEVAATAEAVAVTQPAPAEEIAKAAAETAEQQAIKVLSEERALLAAVDERMGKALLHRLEPLARFFPANPRQIKRIVNAITMYTAVAYLQMDMDEGDSRGIELAIWVIIMTEWPKTWRVLASCPKLADVLAEDKPDEAFAGIEERELPGSRVSTLRELDRIRADRDLLELITSAEGRPRLRSESVELFVRLTPLYSRKQRLPEEEGRSGRREAAPEKA